MTIALNDSKISAEEFSLILSEANTFLETKEKLRSKSKENTDLESKVVKPFLLWVLHILHAFIFKTMSSGKLNAAVTYYG